MNNKGLKFLLVSILSLGIINCGGGGSDSSPEPTPEPVNQKPTANAGSDQTVNEQTVVTIEGTGTDSDGTITSYSWVQTSGPDITLSNTNQQNLEFTAPVAKQATSLEFTLTVTDNDGAKNSDVVIITVNPVLEEKLSINGKAFLNGPLVEADIIASVGSQEFTTLTDNEGNYTVLVEVDESEADQVIKLTAIGNGEQDFIKLVALKEGIASLLEKSGDDLVLDSSESDTNISNITTGVYASLRQENDNLEQLTTTELVDALLSKKEVAKDAYFIAGFLKVIPLYSSTMPEFAIPDDINDTLALALDWKTLKKYTATIRTNHTYNEKFKDAIEEIKTDSRFKLAISEAPEVFADSTGNFLLEFSAGNEGVHNYRIGNQSFTWDLANEALEVSLEGKSISYSFPYKNYAPDQPSPQVEEHIIHDSLKFEKLLAIDSATLVRVNTQGRLHYPNGELPDEPFVTEIYWVVSETYEKYTHEEVPGRMLLPIQGLNDTYVQNTVVGDIEVNEIINADILWFSDDGSVIAEQAFSETGMWNISEKGTLKVSISTGDLEFYKISEHLGFVRFVSAGQDTIFNLGSPIAKKTTNLMDELDVVGIYELPITVIDGYFWLDLQEGGIGTFNSGNDRNDDGVVTDDELVTENIYWEVDGEKVFVRRYWNEYTGPCDPTEPECVYFNERIMHFVELDGKKLYRKNHHKFNLTLIDYPDQYSELDGVWTDDSNSSGYWIMRDEAPLQF